MPEVIGALIAAMSTLMVAALGVFGARRLGIGQQQDKLVGTLKDLVEAQEQKIEGLQADALIDKQKIKELEKRVDQLEELTIRQAEIIDGLLNGRRRSIVE